MSKNTLKQRLLSVPGLGYSLRVASNIIHAPSYRDHDIKAFNAINKSLEEHENKVNSLIYELENTKQRYDDLLKNQDRLRKEVSLIEKSDKLQQPTGDTASPDKNQQLFADDHLLDIFYTNFEDRFRGDEKTIQERLEEYLDPIKKSTIEFDKYPVLDIGSGRGEFLQLLKSNGINAIGLDINIDMVERSKAKGLKAIQGDALNFLLNSEPQTYGIITGFHLIEHIPFNQLLRIFSSAHQALVPEGFVLFETPNPENIIVGSSAFYTDPSHLNPLPPDLTAFALETAGFRNVQINRIHPVPVTKQETRNMTPEVINRFYGPRDYVALGYK